MKQLKYVSLALIGALVGTQSHAAIDTTAVVTEIGSNTAEVLLVGGALLSLAAVAVGIKWIKGTIFS